MPVIRVLRLTIGTGTSAPRRFPEHIGARYLLGKLKRPLAMRPRAPVAINTKTNYQDSIRVWCGGRP
jgi:hypothetical protein